LSLTFTGKAGHAGTTPMQARQDALCGAAEFILAVERGAREVPGLVATVGQIQTQPNATNVIPASATISLDVRHQRNAARNAAVKRLKALARRVARRRGLKLTVQQIQATSAVPCSPRLSAFLKKAVGRNERPVLNLPSGAGHDAVALASLVPVSMLFIRCKGGLSHHPDESVAVQDIRVALNVMLDFLRLLAGSLATS
jgi:allantoate deiminase